MLLSISPLQATRPVAISKHCWTEPAGGQAYSLSPPLFLLALALTGSPARRTLSARRDFRPKKSGPDQRIYELLSNPVYIGEIRHRKERHPGQHEPIVERELWETRWRET
jgi:Recombinase